MIALAFSPMGFVAPLNIRHQTKSALMMGGKGFGGGEATRDP